LFESHDEIDVAFKEMTDHQECFCFMFVWGFFVLCLFVCFWFFMRVVFGFFYPCPFSGFRLYVCKGRSKTQEKSFNYIFNGIEINILICLVIRLD
jgi:hypothetical protein